MELDLDNIDKYVDEIKKSTAGDLAKYMHNNYEFFSKIEGWDTQNSCKVEFENLPKENKKVMLQVANVVMQKYVLPLLLRIGELEEPSEMTSKEKKNEK